MIATGLSAAAQNKYEISGTVKDPSGQALPGASVLLSGYQVGGVTDTDGRFKITGLEAGQYDVLIQMIGYLPGQVHITLVNSAVTIAIVLKEDVQQLREIVIKPDRNRPKYLKQFYEAFLGTSANAKRCKIVNPQVIDFDYDADKRILTASTRQFLIIENLALGYRIKYLLKYFEKNDQSNTITYYGFPHFEEQYSSKKQQKTFKIKRDRAFEGSSQHFFAALFRGKFDNSGFVINKLLKVRNPRKRSEEHMDKQIAYYADLASKHSSWRYTDSLNYWNTIKAAPDSLEVLGAESVSTDTLVHTVNTDLKSMNFTDALYVVFDKEKESRMYKLFSEYTLPRPDVYQNSQISILHQDRNQILFYRNGSIDNPLSVIYEGYWGYEKVADLMPMDYEYDGW